MTLRDEIDKSREDLRKNTYQIITDDDIERIIDRIDEIGELVNRLEIKLFNMSISASPPPASLPPIPEEVLQDAIEVFKETVAEKKRELAHRVVPMKVSED